MAYNLYQVQMANAWAKRIEKEDALAQKFWSQAAAAKIPSPPLPDEPPGKAPGSVASSINTVALKDRLDKLESELALERERRAKVEAELTDLLSKQSTSK
jgi:hypothetical protein